MMNEKFKGFVTNKWFITIAIVLSVSLITFGIISILTSGGDGMRIRHLPQDTSIYKVSDFKESRLVLNDDTKTFEVKIVRRGVVILVGIGTYVKHKKSYDFTYVDMYRLHVDEMKRSAPEEIAVVYHFKVNKKGRIEFYDPNDKYYHFK
jgi:hypothetical protein